MDYIENILNNIPENEERDEYGEFKKQCAKEELRKENISEFYLTRKAEIDKMALENIEEKMKVNFMDEFLGVLNKNIESQSCLLKKYSYIIQKEIIHYRNLRYQAIACSGSTKFMDLRHDLTNLREVIGTMDIVKDFKEKAQQAIEKQTEIDHVDVEQQKASDSINCLLESIKGDFKNLVVSLVTDSNEMKEPKQVMLSIDQQIVAKEKELEELQHAVTDLENEVQELEKKAEERIREQEMEMYLNPCPIEHVDIFKIPLATLRKKQALYLTRGSIIQNGIETFLTDIKQSSCFQENVSSVFNVEKDEQAEFDLDATTLNSENKITLEDEIDYSYENNEQCSTDKQVQVSNGNEQPNNANTSIVRSEYKSGTIKVLENVLVKPRYPEQLLSSHLRDDKLVSSQCFGRKLTVTVDFSTAVQRRAVAICPNDRRNQEGKVFLTEGRIQEMIEFPTDDKQTSQFSSDDLCLKERNDTKIHRTDSKKTHESSKSQEESEIGTHDNAENVQNNLTYDVSQDKSEKEQIQDASHMLKRVGEYLSATTTSRYRKPEKRKSADDLHRVKKFSEGSKPKMLEIDYDSEVYTPQQIRKSQQLAGMKTSPKVSESKRTSMAFTSRVSKRRNETIDVETGSSDADEFLRQIKSSISGLQARPSQKKVDSTKVISVENQKSLKKESPATDQVESESKKKQIEKKSHNFSDFFDDNYDSNEDTSGFDFGNDDSDINSDKWSEMGEGGGEDGCIGFSMDMDMDMEGDSKNSDKVSCEDDSFTF